MWLGSVGLSAAAGALLDKPKALQAATLPPKPVNPLPTVAPSAAPSVDPREVLSLIYDQDYLLYEGPKVGTFWESPNRLQAIVQRLGQVGVEVETQAVKPASFDQIAKAHAPHYIRYIQKQKYLPQDEFALIRKVERKLVNRPTAMATASGAVQPQYEEVIRYVRPPADAPRYTKLKPYEAAALAAGGAIQAVDQVMKGQSQNAFALVRPPGHHATSKRNMGFCVFNNAAVAARHAQAAYGAERVLIIDWDVHHGNGTQEIFYTDPSVLYFSTHQENIYPKRTGKIGEVGAKNGRGYNINVPLPPRTDDAGFLSVFREVLVPVAQAFKPDLIIVSAGQDAHAHDFVAQCRVTDAGFAQMTRVVKELARELCDRKLVFVLEGGYNPKVTARAVENIVKVLQAPDETVAAAAAPKPGQATPAPIASRIAEVRRTQTAFWPTLA